MRGLGDLHLRSMLERMASQFKLEVDDAAAAHPVPRDDHAARPRATTATRSRPAARASSARCSCAIEPLPRGARLRVRRRGEGRHDPDAVHPRGARRACEQVLDARRRSPAIPLQDVRVIVYDGKHHAGRLEGSRVRHRGQARRSSTRSRRRGRSCSSRSSTSRSLPGATRWATSPATSRRSAARSPAPRRCAAGALAVIGQVPLAELDDYARAAEVGDRRPGRVHDGAVALRAGAAERAAAARDRVREAPAARGGLSDFDRALDTRARAVLYSPIWVNIRQDGSTRRWARSPTRRGARSSRASPGRRRA